MKRLLTLLLTTIVLLIGMTSCRTLRTATPVGNYRVTEGDSYTYAKGKQLYIFWGLIRLGKTAVATPPDGNCEVRTYHTFWDRLIGVITVGVIDAQTIAVEAKRVPSTAESKP